MSDDIESRSRLFEAFRHKVLDSAAVIIASLALLIAVFALLFGGIGLYVAADAKQGERDLRKEFYEEMRIYEIYVQKLHAEMIANGWTPPALPGEEEE